MKEQDAAHSFNEIKNNPHEESIKTLAYRCLQWKDGEIKGYDVQMMDSLLPIIMRPLYDSLEQFKAELTRLRSELQRKDAVINELVDVLDFYYSHGYIHGTGYHGNNEIESIIKKAKLNN